jgi:RNA polymerase sigma-70 factor (ECF subfamily)
MRAAAIVAGVRTDAALGRPDEDLVELLRAGDRDALAEVYHRWSTLVHSIALRSLGNHHDAEDVTQQVFVSAWRSRESLRPGVGSLPGWLAAITRRRCADLHAAKSRDRRNALAVAQVSERDTGPPESDLVTDRVVIAQELAELGDPRATVIRLAVIEGRTHEDVAAHLGLPLGTVKSHVRRGLLHLRNRLKEVNP